MHQCVPMLLNELGIDRSLAHVSDFHRNGHAARQEQITLLELFEARAQIKASKRACDIAKSV
jgi:hypothetical protein